MGKAVRCWLLVLAETAGCSDPAVCGDGRPEGDEQCDDGNMRDDDACSNTCRAQDTLDATVVWAPFLSEIVPGYRETCLGVEANEIALHVSGPVTTDERVDCSMGEYRLRALIPGEYNVIGTLYDGAGEKITSGQTSMSFTMGAEDLRVELVFAFEDFTRNYAGDFFFRITWAGADTCQGASPPVVQHVLRLEREGAPLPGGTNHGDPIDGSAPGQCRDASRTSQMFPQSAQDLPWGKATFVIEGRDAAGMPRFKGSFPTFIGAGLANPEMAFDVPLIE